MERIKNPWIIAFGAVALLHLILIAIGADPLASFTKILLAPLLAAWVWQLGGPRLLVVALLFCWVGDVCLDRASWFLAGIAAFGVAHACFITLFVKRGARDALRSSMGGREPWRAGLAVIYLLAAIGVVVWAWNGFDPAIRFAIPVYALLLVGTATTAMALDTRAGVGAALFVVSDMLIALGAAGRLDAEATWHRLAVMALYLFGILLIAAGVLNRELRTKRVLRDGMDITQRTDCWPRLP